MKLVQAQQFSPIALVFETREEAETFWDIIRSVDCPDKKQFKMVQKIGNLFSNEAKL